MFKPCACFLCNNDESFIVNVYCDELMHCSCELCCVLPVLHSCTCFICNFSNYQLTDVSKQISIFTGEFTCDGKADHSSNCTMIENIVVCTCELCSKQNIEVCGIDKNIKTSKNVTVWDSCDSPFVVCTCECCLMQNIEKCGVDDKIE